MEFDFELYKKLLEGIVKDLETRAEPNTIIEGINADVKKIIDHHKSMHEKDKDKSAYNEISDLGEEYSENDTNTTLKRIKDFEENPDKYEGKSTQEKLKDAKREEKINRDVLKKVKSYEQLKHSSGKSDKDLADSIKGLQSGAQDAKKQLIELGKIKSFNLEEKLDDLIESIDDKMEIDKDVLKDLKEFENHLKYITTSKNVSSYLDTLDLKKVKNPSDLDMKDVLSALRELKDGKQDPDPTKTIPALKDVEEVKNPERREENIKNNFLSKMKSSDLSAIFGDDFRAIINKVKNDENIDWKKISEILAGNKKTINILADPDKVQEATTNFYKYGKRIARYEKEIAYNEKVATTEMPEKPEEVEEADTTKVDFGFGEMDFKNRNGDLVDFGELDDEEAELTARDWSKEILDNKVDLKTVKQHYKAERALVAKQKGGFKGLLGRMWQSIKDKFALKKHLKDDIEASILEAKARKEEYAEYAEYAEKKKAWELSEAEKDAINKPARDARYDYIFNQAGKKGNLSSKDMNEYVEDELDDGRG